MYLTMNSPSGTEEWKSRPSTFDSDSHVTRTTPHPISVFIKQANHVPHKSANSHPTKIITSSAQHEFSC